MGARLNSPRRSPWRGASAGSKPGANQLFWIGIHSIRACAVFRRVTVDIHTARSRGLGVLTRTFWVFPVRNGVEILGVAVRRSCTVHIVFVTTTQQIATTHGEKNHIAEMMC
jgi:hypothetical protein